MIQSKKRKDVSLENDTLALLKIQAEKEGRKLKNYMEHILREKANSFEFTKEYKVMRDGMLDKHNKEELNFISESDFRKQTARK
jgi:hypothetical protein